MAKPVPTHTPGPSFDPNRRQNLNLAPQGRMHVDDPGAQYTPEGDNEGHPNIPAESTED